MLCAPLRLCGVFFGLRPHGCVRSPWYLFRSSNHKDTKTEEALGCDRLAGMVHIILRRDSARIMRRLLHSILILACLACGIARAASEKAVALIFFPAENLTMSSSLAWSGECLTVSICEALEMPGVRVTSRAEMMRLVESSDLPPNAPFRRASMIRGARQGAADHLVFGSYSGTADAIQIVMQVLDLKSMKLGNEITTAGFSITFPPMGKQ